MRLAHRDDAAPAFADEGRLHADGQVEVEGRGRVAGVHVEDGAGPALGRVTREGVPEQELRQTTPAEVLEYSENADVAAVVGLDVVVVAQADRDRAPVDLEQGDLGPVERRRRIEVVDPLLVRPDDVAE